MKSHYIVAIENIPIYPIIPMLYCYTLHIAFFSSSATGMTNPNEEHIFRCVKNQQQVFIWSIVSVQFLVNKL